MALVVENTQDKQEETLKAASLVTMFRDQIPTAFSVILIMMASRGQIPKLIPITL
jgi:hypothetical protein